MLGALATLGLVDTAHRQTYRSEQNQVVSDRLQAEMEAVKRLEYTTVALTSTPTHSTDPENPNYRVANGPPATFALNRNGTNSAALVANGVDSVTGGRGRSPGPTPFSSGNLGTGSAGDVDGQIYRYVTWINDPELPRVRLPGAPGLQAGHDRDRGRHARRAGGDRAYEQIQSDVVDGSVAQQPGGVPPPPSPSEAVPYSLSDTPCSQSTRANPSTHATHNTLGPCSAGVQSGQHPGAPDRLFKAAVPSTGAFTGSYDFSTDVLTQSPTDEGLQLPVQPKQCDFSPSRSDGHTQVHRWITGAGDRHRGLRRRRGRHPDPVLEDDQRRGPHREAVHLAVHARADRARRRGRQPGHGLDHRHQLLQLLVGGRQLELGIAMGRAVPDPA